MVPEDTTGEGSAPHAPELGKRPEEKSFAPTRAKPDEKNPSEIAADDAGATAGIESPQKPRGE